MATINKFRRKTGHQISNDKFLNNFMRQTRSPKQPPLKLNRVSPSPSPMKLKHIFSSDSPDSTSMDQDNEMYPPSNNHN